MVGAAGNVLPFDEEEEEPEYELDMEGNPILPEGVTLGYDGSEGGGAAGSGEDLSNHPSLKPTGKTGI